MSRRFLFGLIEVPMWGYRCGHTIAQIELMTADVPFVAYKARNDKPKPGQKGFTRTSEQAQREYEAWKARQEAEKKQGITVDLNTFLATGEIKGEK